MKTTSKALLLFIFVIFCGSALVAQNQVKIDKQESWQIIKEQVLKYNYKDVDIYVSKNILSAKEELEKIRKVNSPSYSCFFFFIDEKPYANWAHPCKYCFVNTITGDVEIINSDLPPDFENMEILHFVESLQEAKLFNFSDYTFKETKDGTRENDYAVIISGGKNKYNNWKRYWNDCAAIYSVLVNIYGYYDDHIYVLMSDGTSSGHDRRIGTYSYDSSPLDLDGDGDNDIQYSATKSNITSVFNTLRGILDSNDHLFIFTTDHGYLESGNNVGIILWGENEKMRDDQFATEVNKINAGRINVTMEQCHSGGFIDDLKRTNRVIATACRADEYSHAMGRYTYDEFVYYWISAVAGETPEGNPVNADTNNDGWISMREAFVYAELHDTQPEHPQYNSTPDGLGCLVSLDPYFWSITGPDLVCYSPSQTFTLHDRPPGSTINWTCNTSLLYPISSQGDNYTVRAKTQYVGGEGWVQANISTGGCDPVGFRHQGFWVGVPDPTIDGNIYPECFMREWYFLEPDDMWGTYYWHTDYKLRVIGSPYGHKAQIEPLEEGTGQIFCDVTNTCGTGYGRLVVYISCRGFKMSPNPADDYVEISIDESKLAENKIDEYEVRIYNGMNIMVSQLKTSKPTLRINTRQFINGIYTVHFITGDKLQVEQLVISH